MAAKKQLVVEGRRIAVSDLDKVLYRGGHFTKAKVIDYYIRVSKFLLPHLKDRPVTLKRFPNGIYGEFFYEKDAPSFTPDWVKTFPVPRRETSGPPIRYILINDLPTLVWLANLANLEIHPFLHRVPRLERPTQIVFDCDPGTGADILTCARVALMLREVLNDLGLQCFPKVSGSKGLQVYVPLNTPVTYEETQPFAKALAELLAQREPKLIVSEMPKAFRAKKVFIDWSQNTGYKTTVSVYSLRAKSHQPYVSVPVEWDELQTAIAKDDADRLYFDPEAALQRLEKLGDLFTPVLKKKQKLPSEVASFLGNKRRKTSVPHLEDYDRKRDFSKTSEPKPGSVRRSRQGGRRRFVIQKHAASHLHYDFRLEMHDVLKSWSVPKGPPFKLDERRLAIATEDHPIDYLEFEGIIPKGQYGGGTVMVWDIGTYDLIEGNYYRGFLRFHLSGKKLKGEWTLQRIAGEQGNQWQLIKSHSSTRTISKERDDESAVTGRSMKEIHDAADARWESNRSHGPDLSSLPKARLQFVEPMLAKIAPRLPDTKGWLYEIKLDGYRALVIKANGKVMLFSRRGNQLNDRFPALAKAFGFLPDNTIIDGEIVALDKAGKPSFSTLQHSVPRTPVHFYAFDILAYENKDVRKLSLDERRKLLEQYALADVREPVRLSQVFRATPDELIAAAKQSGLEGIVAKRASGRYESGERSGSWLKYKTNQGQELVIAGYKPGKDSFDYLLAGYYDKKDLIFIGKIKNGFNPPLRREIAQHFKGLKTTVCPFSNLPEPANARRGEAITAEVMKQIQWLRPKLVAQVEFTEWTKGNHLRHSRFVALRDDKKASEVTHEVAAA